MSRLKDYFTKKRQKRLESDLLMLINRFGFNPLYGITKEIGSSKRYTRRIEEYLIWYTGTGDLLRDFYTTKGIDSVNYFWKRALRETRMLHTGIPGLISKKMAAILFSQGFRLDAKVYTDSNDKIDKKLTKSTQELLNNLIDIMDLYKKFKSQAQNESWCGHTCAKLSHDIKLSDYPIYEFVDIRSCDVIKERGITIAIIFKSWYVKKDVNYRLEEIYSTAKETGDATITYHLYKQKVDGDEVEVPLTTIQETANYKDFVYEGLKGMLAFEKPNILPSHEFIDSEYGASDYEGALDSFDALDEAFSVLIEELRTNKTIRYFPSNLLWHSDDGETILNNEFITNYVMYEGDGDQNANNEIKIQQINDKTEQHKIKFLSALVNAINSAGLSPFALGITGLESVNSSAESQQERNKVTLETRKSKLNLWIPYIKEVMQKALEMCSWMRTNTSAHQAAFSYVDLNFDNLDVNVEFNDYITEDTGKRINTWGEAKMQKVASTYTAVKNIHPDWSEEQINDEVELIRYEEGVSTDSTDNLPNLNEIVENDKGENDES